MLSVSWTTIRLFLHVLGATVWVGGQITLAGLVPTLRSISPDGPRLVARRFNVLAWSAFGLLVVTGIWNLLAVQVGDKTTAWQATLGLKLAARGRLGHRRRRSMPGPGPRSCSPSVAPSSLIGGLAAVFLGLQLSGAT